ncbi:hypothetical protein [Caulobacter segnis]
MTTNTQPSALSAWPNASHLASCLATAGKAAGSLLTIWAVTAGLILTWMHWTIGDYLAAFGQLGASALGDTADFLPALLPTIVRLSLALGGLVIFPMLGGFVSGHSRQAFRGAFGWLSPDTPHAPHKTIKARRLLRRKKIRARRFLLLHLTAVTAAIVLTVSFFVPDQTLVGWIFASAMLLAGGITRAGIRRRGKPMTRGPQEGYRSRSLAIAIYANIALFIWLVVTAHLVLDGFRDLVASLPQPAASLTACGVILALLALYALVSILPRLTALALIGCLAALHLVYLDNRPIAGAVLRAARLGGGIAQPYYPPGAKANASPQLVCLILAIGESRIVWIPDEEAAKTDAPCASKGFKAHFAPQQRQDAQSPFKAATGVRTLRREDFQRPPVSSAGSLD